MRCRRAAESAAAAGAEFCVIPGVDVATAERSAELGMLTLPGVQTPAEIQTALRAGADVLKFFPADPPGAAWLAQVVPAYSQRPFMATGGVTVENMAEFYAAGAIAVGMANTLFGDFRDLERAPSLIAAAVALLLTVSGWLFLELYWWTRPVLLPGLSATDPRRLAAS